MWWNGKTEGHKLANDFAYGLGGSVFTSNPERALCHRRSVDTGNDVHQPADKTLQVKLSVRWNQNQDDGRTSKLGILEFVSTEKLINISRANSRHCCRVLFQWQQRHTL